MHCSVLDEDGSKIATSLVERRLDHGSRSPTVRICLELEHLCLKENLLKKKIHIDTLLCRDFLTLILAAPVLHKNIHV